jgi:hypothetical protein
MKELWINLLQTLGLAWWVEIVTDSPKCTYYFGPFASDQEAQLAKSGYIQDLESEGAQGIKVTVKRDNPSNLTVYDEADEVGAGQSRPFPVFSGQM